MLNHLVLSCPDKALERFEEVSYLIKNKDRLAIEEFLTVESSRRYSRHCADTARGTKASIEEARKFFVSVSADDRVSPS